MTSLDIPRFTVDEEAKPEGNAFQAVCWTGDCGWCSRWHYSDEYADNDPDLNHPHPDDAAYETAEVEGRDHLRYVHGEEW